MCGKRYVPLETGSVVGGPGVEGGYGSHSWETCIHHPLKWTRGDKSWMMVGGGASSMSPSP